MEKLFFFKSQWDSREAAFQVETPPKYLQQLQDVNQMKYDLFTISHAIWKGLLHPPLSSLLFDLFEKFVSDILLAQALGDVADTWS